MVIIVSQWHSYTGNTCEMQIRSELHWSFHMPLAQVHSWWLNLLLSVNKRVTKWNISFKQKCLVHSETSQLNYWMLPPPSAPSESFFGRQKKKSSLQGQSKLQNANCTFARSDQPNDWTVTSRRFTNSFLRTSYSLAMAWLIASIFSWNKNAYHILHCFSAKAFLVCNVLAY